VAIVTPSRKYSRKAIRLCLQGAAKNTTLQKSHYFQNNLIFLVNFSEIIQETFAINAANFGICTAHLYGTFEMQKNASHHMQEMSLIE